MDNIRHKETNVSSKGTQTSKKAATAIEAFANNSINQDIIIKTKGINYLASIFSDADTGVRKRKYVDEGLVKNTNNQNTFENTQSIVRVLALLSDADTDTRIHAAELLRQLAYHNATNQDAIREAHGIVPLIACLDSANPECIKNALATVSALANKNQTNQNAIREAQGIMPVVALLSFVNYDDEGACEAVRIYAAIALWHLADNNPYNQDVMLASNALSLLRSISDNWLAITDSYRGEEDCSDARKALDACLTCLESQNHQAYYQLK